LLPFRELLDRLGAERAEVIGSTARDETVVRHDLLIDPVAARIADVRLQARVRGESTTADDVRLDEHPRCVTDGGDRLACVDERLHEPHGLRIHARLVGVRDAARQDEPVVARRIGIFQLHIDRLGARLVEMIDHLDLVTAERHELELRALLCQPLDRRRQLHLLDALRRGEDRDPLTFESAYHRPSRYPVPKAAIPNGAVERTSARSAGVSRRPPLRRTG
jgi:hypothetical protein